MSTNNYTVYVTSVPIINESSVYYWKAERISFNAAKMMLEAWERDHREIIVNMQEDKLKKIQETGMLINYTITKKYPRAPCEILSISSITTDPGVLTKFFFSYTRSIHVSEISLNITRNFMPISFTKEIEDEDEFKETPERALLAKLAGLACKIEDEQMSARARKAIIDIFGFPDRDVKHVNK